MVILSNVWAGDGGGGGGGIQILIIFSNAWEGEWWGRGRGGGGDSNMTCYFLYPDIKGLSKGTLVRGSARPIMGEPRGAVPQPPP
jgi:hypothetical protein